VIIMKKKVRIGKGHVHQYEVRDGKIISSKCQMSGKRFQSFTVKCVAKLQKVGSVFKQF